MDTFFFNFEKLEAYKCAKSFAIQVYEATKVFPSEEKFGLISQLRRASVSIMSNIVEGNARTTNRDKAHFFTISYSSLMEVVSQIELSSDLQYISQEVQKELRQKALELGKLISGLRYYFLKKHNP